MKVKVRFIAVGSCLPREYIDLEINDNADLDDLKYVLGKKWGGQLIGYWDETRHKFIKDFLIASGNCLIGNGETLFEGQKISITGQIIGG